MANTEDNTVFLTYKYRLLPTKRQYAALADILESQRILYNAALQERIDRYRKTGKSLGYMGQCKSLTELHQDPSYTTVPVKLQRWTLKRIDDAYNGFFRRIKIKGENPGFPRYKVKSRWRSFGFNEFKGIHLRNNRLRFGGLPGTIRVHMHRKPPQGIPLSCTFTRDIKGWVVCLNYHLPKTLLQTTGSHVGIDMGLTTLAMLSTGEAIPNPRVGKKAARELRRRQRAASRCKRGSKRRKKIMDCVARLHKKIANARTTNLHQVSTRLIRENDLIAVEKLNVKGMAAGLFAKSVNDAAWSRFKEILAYKAAKAGRTDDRGRSSKHNTRL